MSRRTVMMMAAVIVLAAFCGGTAPAQTAGANTGVQESVGTTGTVDWTEGVVTAVGIGAPPAQSANPAQARGMAERAAQVVALRNLLEAVKGVRVDAATTVENFVVKSDVVRTQVNGFVQGSTIMDKKYLSDGSVEITVGVRLTGGMADVLFPQRPKTPPLGLTGTPASAAPGQAFTGLIVDARGLGIRPAMAPKILNEDGREVYGSAWISRDYAVREGMAGYLKDPAAARTNPRVTDKPLMVKALKVSGENRVDMVISNADAAALHGMSENLSFLEKCRVIVLVD